MQTEQARMMRKDLAAVTDLRLSPLLAPWPPATLSNPRLDSAREGLTHAVNLPTHQ
jgi:hypothetical protein